MTEEVTAEIIETPNLAKAPEPAITYTLPKAEIKNVDAIEEFVSSIERFFADVQIDVTDDKQVKELKGLRADVNKVASAIDTKRKDMDKAVKAAMGEADTTLNALRDRLKAVYDSTGKQIDEAEKLRLEARMNILRDEYAGMAPDLMELVPLESFTEREKKLIQKAWTGNKACDVLDDMIAKVVSERKTLEELEYANQADMVYCRTLDAAQALAENRRLVEQHVAEEAHKAEAAKLAKTVEKRSKPVEQAPVVEQIADKPGHYKLEFTANNDDLDSFRAFMKQLSSFQMISFKQVHHE